MAPILAGEVGIAHQIIDDERLVQLRKELLDMQLLVPLGQTYTAQDPVDVPLDLEKFIALLEPWQTWEFEEQVDLHEWMNPLNKIDACLSYYIRKYPSLLLISPVQRTKPQWHPGPAESMDDVNSVPEVVVKNLCIVLKFLSGLLTNSSNKAVFNSAEELVDLLAAADDSISGGALEALCCLATPPVLHKQQAPEAQQHSTALHTSRTASHTRLMAMAKGWGTRGSGLGLFSCSTADDSEFGQGALPQEAGEVNFSFYRSKETSEKEAGSSDDLGEPSDTELVRISLLRKEIVDDSRMITDTLKNSYESDESSASKQKRRRVLPATLGEQSIRSTPELFFYCLQKVGGRSSVPPDRQFSLLADIRLARSFHCQSTRTAAVKHRLRAIIAILHSHPSQEIMSGYFQAQPELFVEMIDLLRPTVSAASVSAASSKPSSHGSAVLKQDAISALANSPGVPYDVRELALEALTALVARRDGTTGALTGVARHSNVLAELGVAKGQYLGLLPTLIRFSLASLGSLLSREEVEPSPDLPEQSLEDTIAFDIGLAFVEATMPSPLPRGVQLVKALEFVDAVLTLTSSVVSTPSGTSALTESGLIPALLTAVSIDHEELVEKATPKSPPEEMTRIKALLRFVTAQAVQIIEGAIVTHNNALSAFHDLQGVEVLTERLSKEILGTAPKPGKTTVSSDAVSMELDSVESGTTGGDVDMETATVPRLQCSQRVLLFSIVTCLTVVFHQESTSSSVTVPSGAAELRKPELSKALLALLDNTTLYGGHLASLVITLLSDVMNSDPHVVRHVHECGLAKSFLNFFPAGENDEPLLPPVPELIMAVPNVLSALALTEDGAKAIKEADPFPAMLKLFYHPKYAMPRSKCLLNETAAIVGTGLDEMMRHISSLKPLICAAIAGAMNKVADFGEEVARKESQWPTLPPTNNRPASDLEIERTCLMQYASNFGQVLEQILHNQEHCDPFVSAGGLEALLRLYPLLIPTGMEFLSHTSCLSCPSVSTLGHSTTEDAMMLAFKCIALRYDSFKLLQTVIDVVKLHLSKLAELQAQLEIPHRNSSEGVDAAFVLDGLPQEPIYSPVVYSTSSANLAGMTKYLRQVVAVQWATGLLSAVIKAACQKSQEVGTGWSRQEREWKKALSSSEFQDLVGQLSAFHRSAIFETCRVRTEEGFEERAKRRLSNSQSKNLRYRLRIVCPEGAVIRDGIEIDSCASVGSMEMCEITDGFDRCVNSSGVLRYRTRRGWVSEQTRGHGREPIAEVLAVWESTTDQNDPKVESPSTKRVEADLPDIRTTGANILARLQSSYADLFSSLSRVIVQGVRSLPARPPSYQAGTVGGHVAAVTKMLSTEITRGFNQSNVVNAVRATAQSSTISSGGIAMYLGCLLGHLQSCLFEEKRERRSVNVPLLIVLFNLHADATTSDKDNAVTFFDAIQFIFEQALIDFQQYTHRDVRDKLTTSKTPRRRLSRTIAAALPAVTAVLKRLVSGPSITSSPVASVLTRIKVTDLPFLLGEKEPDSSNDNSDEECFSPEGFATKVLCAVSDIVQKIWIDTRFADAPPYVAHPMATLVGDIIVGLDESTKKSGSNSTRSQREDSGLLRAVRGLVSNRSATNALAEDDFEPSEESITRLMEMGFSRDHAWDAIDSTRSNHLEVAMEYALSHPPASSVDIERRRSERAERRRQLVQPTETHDSETSDPSIPANNDNNNGATTTGNPTDTMDVDQPDTKSDKESGTTDVAMRNATERLKQWKSEAMETSCSIMSKMEWNATDSADGDIEALTVVLCSFMLEICQRYPEERDGVATKLFERLHEQILVLSTDNGNSYTVPHEKESSFFSLCHASVLFTRALPKTRMLVLQRNLVGKILGCTQNALKAISSEEINNFPAWVAPSLLFLDIMTQPVVAFSDKDIETEKLVGDSELKTVRDEHRRICTEISTLAHDLSVALHTGKKKATENKDTNNSSPKEDPSGNIDDSEKIDENVLFKSVPAYAPLLPRNLTHQCVDLCLAMLKCNHLTPGTVHGTLLFLMRLLRSPSLSSYCFKAGLAERILSLPKDIRFAGHTGLITLLLRRLLEDEHTLQAAMETEIRGAIIKLYGKNQKPSSEGKDRPRVSRKAFIQAITPLLCREPASCLRAVAVTVLFENDASSEGTDSKVSLLSTSERAKNVKIVAEVMKRKGIIVPNRTSLSRKSSFGKSKKPGSSPRSRTPVRSNTKASVTPKRIKREKSETKEKIDEDPKTTTATTVTSLLLHHAIQISEHHTMVGELPLKQKGPDFGFDSSFLWTADILGILSDLVLAIPACATAIHKFRPAKNKSNRPSGSLWPFHALSGCPSPPRTFVSFMLHYLIVQDRWTAPKIESQKTSAGVNSSDELKKSKSQALFRRTRVAQSAARLIVALVARPGEGRRRVLAELSFALSGGQLGLPTPTFRTEQVSRQSSDRDICTLQAWGELCIGLAAPRSNGSNYDGLATLSFEVIRLMLECGMAHSLLVAMHKVPLFHPRANSAVGALIVPFEVLSRPTVADATKSLVEKEASSRDSKGGHKGLKHSSIDSPKDRNQDSARRDSFADDHMLEEAFAIDSARSQNIEAPELGVDFGGEGGHNIGLEGDHDDPGMEEMEDEENEMEIDANADEGSDDEMSSDEESEESSDEDDGDSDSSDDDDDGDEDAESMIDDDISRDSAEYEEDQDQYREDIVIENQGFETQEESDSARPDQALDEGWTRIESTGFGGMVLGGRRGLGQQAGGHVSARTRGFIDAAEAMIGTLLRSGEIQGDALAEIEGSLAIQIMHHGSGGQRNDASRADAFGGRTSAEPFRSLLAGDRNRGEAFGTLPQVHQRSQPDVGFSAVGGNGRWSDISSMEFVYGGPAVTVGSRNYDLVPRPTEEEDDVGAAAQPDAPLFPSGPASVAHSRTQHSLHPLLCGVDLPPANALVSDLMPHDIRAVRRGQTVSRRPGDWTSGSFASGGLLVSTSNVGMVRSNRGNSSISLAVNSQPRGAMPVGWTDDGLPVDATVEEFSSAFEMALGQAMATARTENQVNTPTSTRNERVQSEISVPSRLDADAGSITPREDGTSDAHMAEASNSPVVQQRSHSEPEDRPSQGSDDDSAPSSEGGDQQPHLNADGNSPTRLQVLDAQMMDATATAEALTEAEGESVVEGDQLEPTGTNNSAIQDASMEGTEGISVASTTEPNANGLVCPAGMDPEVFNVLPIEMQQEVVEQARTAAELASQLDAGSALDPEALAALPEDMRREVIEQEQRERQLQDQSPADPANAEEMDNASFVASLAPELRQEILMTADSAFLQSLPPNIVAEAQILRERARLEEPTPASGRGDLSGEDSGIRSQGGPSREPTESGVSTGARRKQRAYGKVRVEIDRDSVVYLPEGTSPPLSPPVAKTDLVELLRFLYLLNPVRPQELLQKVFQNLCSEPVLRRVLLSAFVNLLHDDNKGALAALSTLAEKYGQNDWRFRVDDQFAERLKDFPSPFLIGVAPDVIHADNLGSNISLIMRKQATDTASSVAANLPMTALGSRHERYLPPAVATRIVDTLQNVCRSSPRFCIEILVNGLVDGTAMKDSCPTGFEKLLDLLEKPRYSKSSANLEQLLVLLEAAVSPLSNIPKHGEEDVEIPQKDIDAAAAAKKMWVEVPRIAVSQERLQLLCSVLRMETCRDASFTKVNTIARRLCRVDANRGYVLAELASVARALGADAVNDLRALNIRMSKALERSEKQTTIENNDSESPPDSQSKLGTPGSASSTVAVSTSTSELKLLRVLQTLQALCLDGSEEGPSKKNEGNVFVTEELVHLLHAMELDGLWTELTACLQIVQVLEGVKIEEESDTTSDPGGNDPDDENAEDKKKLQNSVAGLLTRFLPSIEAFFVANASATRKPDQKDGSGEEVESDEHSLNNLVGGANLIQFVTANKVLLNALIRNNASLLDKGLRALIHVPQCHHFLDFDVKRQWFKTQVRRLRQQANRRFGSLRLHIRRQHVFEDAYHQLCLRNADEMRGRLHVTFRDEEGVDAGGLSREFFGILAKEIFNPNYALFTSTEDGSTFQPNPRSNFNPDHLSYFRFVGRIVGKAVSDGYLLDAHFTRSLYKHMLGIKPTHHDMEAIDPDYYRNLKTILEYDLRDLALELTFSIEDHSFGEQRLIDLIPGGSKIPVTEENKAKYVSLVCQHRMTTSISSQISAYLDGFYELVSRDLITIFTPRELELLISGLPDIDVHDLKKNTDYVGWKATDTQIQWFWNALFSLSRNEKAAFLQFVTGSSKVPLVGFGELPGMRGVQKFSIHKASGSAGALMSAHTCFNSLDLPVYSSEKELKEKLLYAITEGGGTFLLA